MGEKSYGSYINDGKYILVVCPRSVAIFHSLVPLGLVTARSIAIFHSLVPLDVVTTYSTNTWRMEIEKWKRFKGANEKPRWVTLKCDPLL